MIRNTSPASPASTACATAAPTRSCISKAPTSIAAGFIPRCSKSCGTRGRAPYDAVLTHGFVLDEKGQKMSKSLGNVTAPQSVIKDAGADILRLWVAASDYSDDLRIGPEILKTFVETYRKLRNTIRWMLGSLAHYDPTVTVERGSDAANSNDSCCTGSPNSMARSATAYQEFDYKRVVARLSAFLNTDLSAFYFDIRKDTLYCDPPSSEKRRAALAAIEQIFRGVTLWLAPILAFTFGRGLARALPADAVSVHLETFPGYSASVARRRACRKMGKNPPRPVGRHRRARNRAGAKTHRLLARSRAASLYRRFWFEGHSRIGVDFAEVCITSDISIEAGQGPAEAFRLDDVPGVAVVPARAQGRKCARSWKISPLVGSDPEFPDVTPRDAQALRELRALGQWP